MNTTTPLFHSATLFVLSLILLISCEQPIDPVINHVNETESVLHKYKWYLNNFQIETKSDAVPPPILWGENQFELPQGDYDIDDMPFDAISNTVHEFTAEKDIVAAREVNDFQIENIGSYFIINDQKIRISNDNIKLNYRYQYLPELKHFELTVNEEDVSKLINDANEKLVKYAANGTPDKIGGLVTRLLYHNETIQGIINDAIRNWLSGKVEFIDTITPEESAQYVSEELFNYLESLQLRNKLAIIIQEELNNILDFDAEEVSKKISEEVASLVSEKLSTEQIYEYILPYMDEATNHPKESAENISKALIKLVGSVLSEENVSAIVNKAWESFTEMKPEEVTEIALVFTSTIEENWINEANIYYVLYPFVQKIEDTSILKMGELADEATDAIKSIVDIVNDTFDDIQLDPDYDTISSTLKTAFTAAKPIISLNGGAEKTTTQISSLVKNEFLSTQFIQNTIESIIIKLQQIPSEEAAKKITGLLSRIGQYLSPEVEKYITTKLTLAFTDKDPEYLSFKIAKSVNTAITNLINEENLTSIVFPVIEKIRNLDTEQIGSFVANKIMDLDIIQDNINQENVSKIITDILVEAQDLGSENIAQGIINGVVNSGIFENTITEERVSLVISLILYNAAYQDVKVANNFSSATIVLEHK
ncbi:hypothetical protein [Flammeovirga agarivorans]|uniref:Uncharacterized protein n=1 Tax=Flammeovirga agarivorans TaxID=2726742 RepID=A0A7X8SPL9_9BACT|nr:hypothetical protein [Flammeovirga agarivorans]NLR93985.1 hypothetical protein [Flammeovirga agarivorans]